MTGLSRPWCPGKRRDQARRGQATGDRNAYHFLHVTTKRSRANPRRVSCGFLAKLLLLFLGNEMHGFGFID
jgi:hypothetical protein